MSPSISAVPPMQPSQLSGRGGGDGGTISATGSPNRVMRMGLPVRRTRLRTARHVALNFEIAISSSSIPHVRLWSQTMVNYARGGCGFPRHARRGLDAAQVATGDAGLDSVLLLERSLEERLELRTQGIVGVGGDHALGEGKRPDGLAPLHVVVRERIQVLQALRLQLEGPL